MRSAAEITGAGLDLPPGFAIRLAGPDDLDYLVATDLIGEGYTFNPDEPPMSADELAAHRAKIAAFVAGGDDMAWVVLNPAAERAGMILARYRDFEHEPVCEANSFLLRFLPRELFPQDGRFCEVFNLYVRPVDRRKGLASALKRSIEIEAAARGMHLVYTHTETTNAHVITLNLRLGYRVVRVGPIWDSVERTSLVKQLE